MTSKLPPPSVWVNSNRCIFGTSVFDRILSSSSSSLRDLPTDESSSERNPDLLLSNPLHYDRTLVSLKHDYDGQLELLPAPFSDASSNVQRIPFGRSRSYSPLGSHADPTTVAATQAATRAEMLLHGSGNKNGAIRRFVQLAVVGLVVSPQNEILITRRPSYMRSFPGAWVFPGGSVDNTDNSLEAAIAREIWEETGLQVEASSTKAALDAGIAGETSGGWTIESIWESVFPTIPEPGVPIKRHHLVVYLSLKLSESEMNQMSLKLCDEEVDAAVWLSPEHVDSVLAKSQSQAKPDPGTDDEEIWVDLLTSSNNEVATKTGFKEPLKHLSGIYPRFEDYASTQHPFGMAQGSLFALQEYWHRHRLP